MLNSTRLPFDSMGSAAAVAQRRGITDGGRSSEICTTLSTLLNSDHHLIQPCGDAANFNDNIQESSSARCCISGETPPYYESQTASPYVGSPWTTSTVLSNLPSALVGSLVREEGHVYSLATSGDLLYTGSESKNIRVWKRRQQLSGGFKSTSGFVKAIVVIGDRIFTGHQDGKIRVWRTSTHKRVGTLPKLRDCITSSFNPTNYVKERRNRKVLWIKHFDAVSCLTHSEDREILYSGSWDRTVKVWRVSDFKCLESINAHDDAVNSVVTGFGGLVFSGSADGTLRVWRREMVSTTAGRALGIRHVAVDTLLKQDRAVTSLAVNSSTSTFFLYCGSSDGMVNHWEVEKQYLSHGGVLRGHKMAVLCLATSGSLVFSGSTDRTICVWRRSDDGDGRKRMTHACLSVLTGHLGPVKCLAVDDHESEDDETLVLYSGSLDRSVKVWKVSEMAHHHSLMSPFRTPRLAFTPPSR